MAGFGQYLRDTRAELRHVAWPTQLQTIVYTVLVAAISIGVALYLGFFDYLFTTGLSRTVVGAPSANQAQVTDVSATPTPAESDIQVAPSFNLDTGAQQ